MSSLILGTAGHIDHGKTALIKALTGTDTDRLKAEKERGISIELGFASLTLQSGKVLGIVDVPGHEKLVRTMVSGATGIDLVLLVVAADDGIMPQTIEHLSIIDLLGIERGIVAITKTDLVEPDWVDLVVEEVGKALKGTSIEGSPILAVSSKTGDGLPELLDKTELVAKGIERRKRDFPFRMPVDRVFTISGAGTVITGTAWSGRLKVDERVAILPQGTISRVRSLQVHGNKVPEVGSGTRVAINLAGTSLDEISRGDVIVSQDFKTSGSPKLMLELKLLKTAKPLKNRSVIRFHHGTRELIGRVILPNKDELKPGEKGLAILRLTVPVVSIYGDRYIVRSYSPVNTIGGGRILIPALITTKRKEETILMISDRLERGDLEGAVRVAVERIHYPLSMDELTFITGLWGEDLKEALENSRYWSEKIVAEGEAFWCPKEWPDRAVKEISVALAEFHKSDPSAIGLEKENLRALRFSRLPTGVFDVLLKVAVEKGLAKKEGGLFSHPDAAKGAMDTDQQVRDRIHDILSQAGFNTPSEQELIRQLGFPVNIVKRAITGLASSGRLVRVKPDLIFTSESVERAKSLLKENISRTGGITPAEFRELISSSRKYAIPLLEYFDVAGVTKREGDVRVLAK